MAYSIAAGIQISLDGSTWYQLTDHNRKEIQANPTLIEKSQRMANGTMRKYVIAKKQVISTSWEMIPSKSSLTVDYDAINRKGLSSAWVESFYNANAGLPIYVKLVASKDTAATFGGYPSDTTFGTAFTQSTTYTTFITKFSVTIKHRNTNTDYVNMDIEFTEI